MEYCVISVFTEKNVLTLLLNFSIHVLERTARIAYIFNSPYLSGKGTS